MILEYRTTVLSLAICLAVPMVGVFPASADTPAVLSAPAHPAAIPYNWRNVEIVGGGFVPGIVFSKSQKGLAYARTDIGGAYRWDQATKRWIPLTDWVKPEEGYLMGIESIALDPNDSNKLYVAAGMYTNDWGGNASMLRSDDQGKTWKRFDLPFKMGGNESGRSMGERLAVDPGDGKILYFGSRNNGLWKSTDGSATWKKVDGFPIDGKTNNGGISFVLFDPSSSPAGRPTSTIYAGSAAGGAGTAGLYRSTDGGVSWSAVPGQPTGLLAHRAELTPEGTLYITYSNALGPNDISDGAVWKLNTKTGAWSDITPVKPHSGTEGGFGYAGVSVDAQHPDTLVVSTLDRWNPGDDIFRSTDAGRTWKAIRPEAVRDGSGSPFVNWGLKTSRFGWWIGCVEIDPFDSNHALYGTGATIWGTDDLTNADSGRPTQWTVRAQGLEETAVISLISPPAGPHLISGLGDIGGFTHDDLTVSPPRGMTVNPMFNNTDDIDYAASAPNLIVRVGRGGERNAHGSYSTDGGAKWSPFPSEPPQIRGSGEIAVSADGKTILWSLPNAGIFRSSDLGATWTKDASDGKTADPVVADRADPNTFYRYDPSNSTLCVSRDTGLSWSVKSASFPAGNVKLYATPEHAGDLWLIDSKSNLYHSRDGGNHFVKVSGVTAGESLGFGKAAPGSDFPAIYLAGTSSGVRGVFRSTDAGASWVRIDDDDHRYGWRGEAITGDPRIFGRVYLGTNGRGILYADPAGNDVPVKTADKGTK